VHKYGTFALDIGKEYAEEFLQEVGKQEKH